MTLSAKSICRKLHTSASQLLVCSSINASVGRTPVISAQNLLSPEARHRGVQLFFKCESFNPTLSVKDRLALALVLDAEERGVLKPGSTIVEATSGNAGIALGSLCAERGYSLVAIMSEHHCIERRRVMRAWGAKVILTAANFGTFGMVNKAIELSKAHGWVHLWQMHNPANAKFHEKTTGVEILEDFADRPLDFFVAGFGTGGTFAGVTEALKKSRPNVRMVLVEPALSPMISSGIPQPRDISGWATSPHHAFRLHRHYGLAPNFVPQIIEQSLKKHGVDGIKLVTEDEAEETANRLRQECGLSTGMSGGTNAMAALRVAEAAPDGSVILSILPDAMDRYLSTVLMDKFVVDMNDEEEAISRSTPNYRYGKEGPIDDDVGRNGEAKNG